MAHIVQAMSHAQVKQPGILHERLDDGIQILRAFINVQSAQRIHLENKRPLIFRKRCGAQERGTPGMYEEIMQNSNSKK